MNTQEQTRGLCGRLTAPSGGTHTNWEINSKFTCFSIEPVNIALQTITQVVRRFPSAVVLLIEASKSQKRMTLFAKFRKEIDGEISLLP